MTGRGCDDIFRILDSRNCTFGDMFRRCERRYGLDNFHFTRLDIAIDDKNEKTFFTIEQIKKKCEKEEFISNSEGYHFDESKFDDFDTAKTVYIGAGKSGLSYRFYDKDKEVCSKHNKTLDVTNLVRISKKKGLKLNMLMCWCISAEENTLFRHRKSIASQF